MKKILAYIALVVVSLITFSCAINQDSINSIKSNTPTPLETKASLIQITPTFANLPKPSSTSKSIPTKTPLPYWGTSVASQFNGKWFVYENNEYGFSFRYPQPDDNNPCGKLIFNEHTNVSQLNFEKGGILIEFSYVGDLDLNNYARNYPKQFNSVLITGIEQFKIGGAPAVRFIYRNQSSYAKKASAIKNSTMYDFGFREGDFSECDTPELSEEQVYESIISTWKFLE